MILSKYFVVFSCGKFYQKTLQQQILLHKNDKTCKTADILPCLIKLFDILLLGNWFWLRNVCSKSCITGLCNTTQSYVYIFCKSCNLSSGDLVLARKLLYATCGACYMHLHFWYADIPSRILSYEASKDYKTILTSILNVKCCLTIVYIFCITCFCYKSSLKYKRQGIHLLSLLRPCGNRILEKKIIMSQVSFEKLIIWQEKVFHITRSGLILDSIDFDNSGYDCTQQYN